MQDKEENLEEDLEENIMRDLRLILKDDSLLVDFIEIDDINKMYDFCKNMHVDEDTNYTEEAFFKKINSLIESLPSELTESNEW